MEISKVQIVPASPDRVWAALNDPQLLQACITGCEAMERIADNEYRIAMKVKVGPVNAKFTGKISIVDLKPPESYTLNFEGQGGMAGFAKGVATVALSAEGEATRLAYTASAQIGGKLAQIGSRLVDGAAHKTAADFFAALARELDSAPDAPAAHDESLNTNAQDASAAHEDKPQADVAEAFVPAAPQPDATQISPAPAPGSQAPPT
ncbi:MAG TPA: carbon monoxide dehydrogenase subunit G [Noviherbaspirillum sp.]|uniref:CoxG family protein n=1 Tax=Noviherbaspirillum sp. TaxID=1926288 RepID=UPI002D47B490|nr:carbon monoxide dehydrogenase subunit G [Noviherbaspirillum sp.]HYD94544.1 carbon monoxide dehydrogenase subunit G [Noviherbaspirillum sp.]